MVRKLKVYRTPIGFHNAYVAATSQRAALEAWGADVDLFARGVAEAVTDETLTAEPLEKPGTVIRRLRGTIEEHMAALPEDPPQRKRATPESDERDGPSPRRRRAPSSATDAESPPPKAKPRPKPRPSRARLDEAEQALDRARADHAEAIAEIRLQEKDLQRRRREIEQRRERDLEKLEAMVAKARAHYGAAIETWRG